MASISKRGKTYSVIHYEGIGKNRHQVWESGLSYTAAKARKAQLELDEVNNVHVDQNNITVEEFLREFLVKYGEKKWVSSTYDGNRGILENYVFPYWGDKKIKSIRVKTVDDFYHFLLTEAEPAANMGKPRRTRITPSTIHDIHKVLRCAFNLAKKWEYIAKNPFIDATLPEHKQRERKNLTAEQIMQVLTFTDRPEYYDYYVIHCAIQMAFFCCMRGGEVGGMQWDRFFPQEQRLYIDRVIDRTDKHMVDKLTKMDVLFTFPNLYPGTRTSIILKQPKTEGSIRYAIIRDTLTQKLLKLKEMQEKLRNELGDDGYMTYDLVICQANGRPLMTEHLNKRFKEVLTAMNDPAINVSEIVFHSIRHTSTSAKLVLSEGDLNTVKAEGGWNTIQMVAHYSHTQEANRDKLADRMEESYGTVKKENKPHQGNPTEVDALIELVKSNPDLLTQFLQSIQSANKE